MGFCWHGQLFLRPTEYKQVSFQPRLELIRHHAAITKLLVDSSKLGMIRFAMFRGGEIHPPALSRAGPSPAEVGGVRPSKLPADLSRITQFLSKCICILRWPTHTRVSLKCFLYLGVPLWCGGQTQCCQTCQLLFFRCHFYVTLNLLTGDICVKWCWGGITCINGKWLRAMKMSSRFFWWRLVKQGRRSNWRVGLYTRHIRAKNGKFSCPRQESDTRTFHCRWSSASIYEKSAMQQFAIAGTRYKMFCYTNKIIC